MNGVSCNMSEREKKTKGKKTFAEKFIGRNYTQAYTWIDGYSYGTRGGGIWGDVSCKLGPI